MPRPNLQEAIKKGVLTPGQLSQMVGISTPTIRSLCLSEKLRHIIKPSSRREIGIPANLAILDLHEIGHFKTSNVPEELILAARFYIAHRQLTSHPVPDSQIPAECAVTPVA